MIHMAKLNFATTIQFAMECKAQMLNHGARRARKTCPICGATVNMVLAGPRNHIHLACETQNCMRLME